VALWLIYAPFGGFRVVFATATTLAIIGAGVGTVMARYVPSTVHRRSFVATQPWWRELFNIVDRDVFLPSVMLFCLNLSFPAVTSFIVLYARDIGIENFGSYFVVSGAQTFSPGRCLVAPRIRSAGVARWQRVLSYRLWLCLC